MDVIAGGAHCARSPAFQPPIPVQIGASEQLEVEKHQPQCRGVPTDDMHWLQSGVPRVSPSCEQSYTSTLVVAMDAGVDDAISAASIRSSTEYVTVPEAGSAAAEAKPGSVGGRIQFTTVGDTNVATLVCTVADTLRD
jgi:hypothetical protein